MTKSEIQSRLRAAIATIAEITGIDERELTNIVTLAWYGRQADQAGGYDPAIKSALCGAIIHATEAAGLWNQARFLAAIGMDEDWLGRAIKHPDTVPLGEYVRVYDQAAEQADWQPLHLIVKEVTLRQRYREWP